MQKGLPEGLLCGPQASAYGLLQSTGMSLLDHDLSRPSHVSLVTLFFSPKDESFLCCWGGGDSQRVRECAGRGGGAVPSPGGMGEDSLVAESQSFSGCAPILPHISHLLQAPTPLWGLCPPGS